jgi:DNA-binding transcriptional MerR regulator
LNKQYRVHQFAELAGVTPKALRHYDRLGLLKPVRTANGYRVYSEKELARLEQIVALKFLGLPLEEIKRALNRGTPLAETLAGQRMVLKEKRHLLDRAIHAIQDVEGVIASGKHPDSAILKQLIEVIAMQKHVQAMKQYYSDEAWEKLTRLRQEHSGVQRSGITKSWSDLFCEAKSLLGEDPGGDKAQDFCRRWFQHWQSTTGGDAGVLAGHRKAWADRVNWPTEIQHLFGGFDAQAVGDFISKAYAASMRKYYGNEAWRKVAVDRPEIAQAWKALYDEIRAVLNQNPASEKGRELAKKWWALWDITTQGDPEIRDGIKRAWQNRGSWPLPLQQQVAERKIAEIADWIGKAIHELRAAAI